VDGEWKYAPDMPAMHDERNIINNVVEVQEYVPDHLDSLVGFEPPPSPPGRYLFSEAIIFSPAARGCTTDI
jgi:5'-AMP-activated protein kinase regulatory beta subunit